MKPAAFEYARPASVAEACALLAGDDDARLIAGGQTLVPMMAMRLARPTLLVDIARLPELIGIADEGDAIVIGAATRQTVAEHSPIVASKIPLLAKALPFVGHAPTRNRGTLGGSVANADPAAEIPLVLTTLDGAITVQTTSGARDVATQDFFLGPMMTATPPGGCVTRLRFPVWNEPRLGAGFQEISARQSDFAYVAAAAQVALDDKGTCTRCAVGVGAATPAPVRLETSALVGTKLDEATIRAALAKKIEELDIMIDHHASQAYRRRVALSLASRALAQARDEALGARA